MGSALPWVVGGSCLVVGLAVGLWIGVDPPPAKEDGPARAERDASASSEAPSRRRRQLGPEARKRRQDRRARRGRVGSDDAELADGPARADDPADAEGREDGPALGDEDGGALAPEEELQRLRAELASLREERKELMGEPVSAPAELPSRLQGPALSGAVSQALTQEEVGGGVEAVDCSEHPCIVFGRLEGDEEDMEEVERAPALKVYDDDVLSLLFWATSVEEAKGEKVRETGLFALAFYSPQERAERGEALERRIRARVMEYWNHDRPGAAEPGAAEP